MLYEVITSQKKVWARKESIYSVLFASYGAILPVLNWGGLSPSTWTWLAPTARCMKTISARSLALSMDWNRPRRLKPSLYKTPSCRLV